MSTTLRIGTRGSDLALWQSRHIREQLQRHHPDLEVELEIITTEGDRIQDRPLHEVGGKGLFVRAIEQALLEERVDLAVHSMKDLPAMTPAGLLLACTPAREDPRDALCCDPDGRPATLRDLPAGTRVGTGSLRRGALVRRINPQVEVVPIRGNVPTRLRKVDDGEVDAVILAAAGLRRLGLHERISESLDPASFCPAPAQGILSLQCRTADDRVRGLLEPLADVHTTWAAAAERGCLTRLGAGCTVPVGCHALVHDDAEVSVHAVIADPSGYPCLQAYRSGPVQEARQIGVALAEHLLSLGARDVADLSG